MARRQARRRASGTLNFSRSLAAVTRCPGAYQQLEYAGGVRPAARPTGGGRSSRTRSIRRGTGELVGCGWFRRRTSGGCAGMLGRDDARLMLDEIEGLVNTYGLHV